MDTDKSKSYRLNLKVLRTYWGRIALDILAKNMDSVPITHMTQPVAPVSGSDV